MLHVELDGKCETLSHILCNLFQNSSSYRVCSHCKISKSFHTAEESGDLTDGHNDLISMGSFVLLTALNSKTRGKYIQIKFGEQLHPLLKPEGNFHVNLARFVYSSTCSN